MDQQIASKSEPSTTLDRILACALEHFSKYGYLGASVREITGSAQVTKPTLYYYFRNKEELYRALAADSFNKMHLALNFPPTLKNLTEDFCSLVDRYYSFCDENLPAARFVQMVSFAPTRDLPDVGVAEFKRKIDLIIERIVLTQETKNLKLDLVLQGLFSLAVERRLGGLMVPISGLREVLESLVPQ